VEFFTLVFSGFQIRNVRSAAPVAIRVPVEFQHRVLTLWAAELRGLSVYVEVLSFEKVDVNADLGKERARVGGAISR